MDVSRFRNGRDRFRNSGVKDLKYVLSRATCMQQNDRTGDNVHLSHDRHVIQ